MRSSFLSMANGNLIFVDEMPLPIALNGAILTMNRYIIWRYYDPKVPLYIRSAMLAFDGIRLSGSTEWAGTGTNATYFA